MLYTSPVIPDSISSSDRLFGPGRNLRTVIFDLDGTLRFNCPSYTEAFYDYAVSLGAPDGAEQRRRAMRWTHYYWAQSDELFVDLQAFPGSEEQFWLNYAVRSLRAFDCPEECIREIASKVHAYMTHHHQPVPWVPPEVPETLGALQAAGYQLALVTNRNRPCQEELAELGLLDYFELTLTAGEAGAWKPDPAIFALALQRLGATAEAAIYVGDNYYADVVGARGAGLRPVLLDPQDIFPDADCPVIRTLTELQVLIR
jgi:HAD superfamily hydrolase (TIGR01509 family)